MPSDDPTQSTTRRRRWESEFNSRWRELRGGVSSLLQSGSSNGRVFSQSREHFHPTNDDVESADQIADFRDWFEERVYADVVEPLPRLQVKRGAHWTAPTVGELYTHGLRLANTDARRSDELELDETRLSVIADADNHRERERDWRVTTYNYLEDAARDTERAVTRVYQRAVREQWSISDTVAAINGSSSRSPGEYDRGRIPAIGENRTRLLAHSVGVQIVNDAILERARDLGVEQVGVDVETIPVDKDEQEQLAPYERPSARDEQEQLAPDEWHAWQTAGDDRVCDQCASLAGQVYTIDAIRAGDAPLPIRDTHLGCRCRFVLVGRTATDYRARRSVSPRQTT